MNPLMNALMPGEHDYLRGKPMPGQVAQAPTPMQQQPAQRMMQPQQSEPAKRGGFLGGVGNALSTVFKYGAPEAFEQGRQMKARDTVGNALAGGDYESAAQAALKAGNIDQGLQIRTAGTEQQAAQRQQQAQGVLQLFTTLEPGQVAQYAMEDPQGFERMTGMSADEFTQAGARMRQMGVTPEQFTQMVVQKAQAELGQAPKAAEPFTLGKDQVRYDAQGNQIAAGPAGGANLPSGMFMNPETGQPEYLPGYIEGQRQIAEARGSNANNVQSTFTGQDGTQYIVRRDGSLEPLGVKARNPFQITDVGGVPTAIDRLTGQGQQVTSPETVGQNKATISTITANEGARQEAQQGLPLAIEKANRSIETIESLVSHPGFEQAYGIASYVPAIRGTDRAGADALREQIGGQAFLEAFQSLKGGGQITEIEGQKATAAITRLANPAISPAEARQAANEFIGIIRRGVARARAEASGAYAPQDADAPPLVYNPETGDFE